MTPNIIHLAFDILEFIILNLTVVTESEGNGCSQTAVSHLFELIFTILVHLLESNAKPDYELDSEKTFHTVVRGQMSVFAIDSSCSVSTATLPSEVFEL